MKARLDWYRYWHITRRIQRIGPFVAHRAPQWLKYWIYIDVVAAATTRPPLDRVEVGQVRVMDVLEGMRAR